MEVDQVKNSTRKIIFYNSLLSGHFTNCVGQLGPNIIIYYQALIFYSHVMLYALSKLSLVLFKDTVIIKFAKPLQACWHSTM